MNNVLCKTHRINPSPNGKCSICGKRGKIVGEVFNVTTAVEGGPNNRLLWRLRPQKHYEDIKKRKLLPNGKVGRFEGNRRVG